MAQHYAYQTRNPLAAHNPLRSIPLSRPVSAVFGPCKRIRVEAELRIANAALTGEMEAYAEDRAALGAANRRPMTTRRWWQGQALRRLNGRRKLIRAAQRRVQSAAAAVAALTPVDDFRFLWQAEEAGVVLPGTASSSITQPLQASA